jgi:hypothetical protein
VEIAIQVVWWLGLLVALLFTLVILKRVFGLLHVLRGILALAEHTHAAARGLARHAEAAGRLETLRAPVSELPHGARRLAEATAAIALQVGAPVAEARSGGAKGG